MTTKWAKYKLWESQNRRERGTERWEKQIYKANELHIENLRLYRCIKSNMSKTRHYQKCPESEKREITNQTEGSSLRLSTNFFWRPVSSWIYSKYWKNKSNEISVSDKIALQKWGWKSVKNIAGVSKLEKFVATRLVLQWILRRILQVSLNGK